jgi:CBS-domain-containing membrane protein
MGALPVCDAQGTMQGIVSERDLIRECFQRLDAIKATKVGEVMTRDVAIEVPEDDLEKGGQTPSH